MLELLKADLRRYRSLGIGSCELLCMPSIWVQIWYRFGQSLYASPGARLLKLPLKFIYRLGEFWVESVPCVVLPPRARIGPGLHLLHLGNIHIHPEVVIGRNCNLTHDVTIGASGMGRKGVPQIGDDVYIGRGSSIIGRVKIGDQAHIAANSLVITNVPAGATVMGVPAQIVMQRDVSSAAKSIDDTASAEH